VEGAQCDSSNDPQNQKENGLEQQKGTTTQNNNKKQNKKNTKKMVLLGPASGGTDHF